MLDIWPPGISLSPVVPPSSLTISQLTDENWRPREMMEMSISQNTDRQHGMRTKDLWLPRCDCFLLSPALTRKHTYTHTHIHTHTCSPTRTHSPEGLCRLTGMGWRAQTGRVPGRGERGDMGRERQQRCAIGGAGLVETGPASTQEMGLLGKGCSLQSSTPSPSHLSKHRDVTLLNHTPSQ